MGADVGPPDLTGLSERDRRLFALGANWAEGATLEAVVATMESSRDLARRGDGTTVLEGMIQAFREVGWRSGVLEALREAGIAP